MKPVSPFVVVTRPAPPGRTNGPPLPCSGIRSPQRRDFYLGHTPTLQRLNHAADRLRTCRTHRAPGTTPAAAELPGLAAVVHQSVTLLGRVTGRVYVVCPRSRGGIVSVSAAPSARRRSRFQRAETRSSRLPLNVDSSRFGTVSD